VLRSDYWYRFPWLLMAVALALTGLGLAACVVALISPRLLPRHELAGPVLVGTAAVLAAAALLVLALPATRRHFQSGGD
jgi:hypothetical protein